MTSKGKEPRQNLWDIGDTPILLSSLSWLFSYSRPFGRDEKPAQSDDNA
jgi:hypothetical protein